MHTDWISTEEAAQISGYHPEYVRRLIRQGKIKVSRKGIMFWIDKASLMEYLRKSQAESKKDKRHGPKRKAE